MTAYVPGTLAQSGADYTLTGVGDGIGGTSDQWIAGRASITGDCTIIAKVSGVTGTTTASAFAGLSFRGLDDPGSKAVHLLLSSTGVSALYRSIAGSTATTVGTTSGFDYYISPTGSNSNDGLTTTTPWALTALNSKRATYAGKRVGLMDGTYSCLTILGTGTYTGDFATPAFNIAGGTSTAQTVIKAVNARAAILDGQTTSTATNPNGQPLIGTIGDGAGSSTAGLGYITIDGLKIINTFNRAVSCGALTGAPFSGTRLLGMIVQNCDISAMTNTLAGANPTAITIYSCDGAAIQNNKIYGMSDTTTRASGIEIWTSRNCTTQYNSVTGTSSNSGGILHKNASQQNNTIRFNYIDMTLATAGSYGMTCDADGGAGTSITINNNVIVSDNPITPDAADVGAYPSTVHIKNIFSNTFVGKPNYSVGAVIFFGAAGTMNFYNNIIKRNTVGGRGDFDTSVSAPALQDYNCYPATAVIGLSTNGTTDYPASTYNLATIGAALPGGCVGKEAHSLAAAPVLTGSVDSTGLPATAYKLGGASPCLNAGKSDGTTSGATCDMGAWGNTTATRIGADF